MIASLPMYARPENRQAHDRLWQAIGAGLRDRGIAAPDQLDHAIDHIASWRCADLVLGQICNLPYRRFFAPHVTCIGAADYGLEGCAAGYYRSLFVVRRDAAETRPQDHGAGRFVYNDIYSQSGYGAAQVWAAARGFQFTNATATGAHWASITAIAEGRADIASIDAQTWRMALAWHPDAGKLAVIGATDPSPGMSFITAGRTDPTPYAAAIREAIGAMDRATSALLGLRGIVALDAAAYDLPDPPNYRPACPLT